MSYADQFQLANDSDWLSRNWSALASEAVAKPEDPLSQYILADPNKGVTAFQPWISSAPGFADAYSEGGQESITDAELLAAIQSAWPKVKVPAI